jgi:hypothetical protein
MQGLQGLHTPHLSLRCEVGDCCSRADPILLANTAAQKLLFAKIFLKKIINFLNIIGIVHSVDCDENLTVPCSWSGRQSNSGNHGLESKGHQNRRWRRHRWQ